MCFQYKNFFSITTSKHCPTKLSLNAATDRCSHQHINISAQITTRISFVKISKHLPSHLYRYASVSFIQQTSTNDASEEVYEDDNGNPSAFCKVDPQTKLGVLIKYALNWASVVIYIYALLIYSFFKYWEACQITSPSSMKWAVLFHRKVSSTEDLIKYFNMYKSSLNWLLGPCCTVLS